MPANAAIPATRNRCRSAVCQRSNSGTITIAVQTKVHSHAASRASDMMPQAYAPNVTARTCARRTTSITSCTSRPSRRERQPERQREEEKERCLNITLGQAFERTEGSDRSDVFRRRDRHRHPADPDLAGRYGALEAVRTLRRSGGSGQKMWRGAKQHGTRDCVASPDPASRNRPSPIIVA